jgi:hypothetical protein
MIRQALCTSFKAEVLLGVHDMRASGGDTFKIALYTASADLGPDTASYTTVGECAGSGYTAGGIALTNSGVTAADGKGFASFANATFTGVTVTTRGALIYNSTPSANGADGSPLTNPAVCVLDFGEDKVVIGGNLTITFPTNNSSNAIVRIA